jgi:hypothetical protein
LKDHDQDKLEDNLQIDHQQNLNLTKIDANTRFKSGREISFSELSSWKHDSPIGLSCDSFANVLDSSFMSQKHNSQNQVLNANQYLRLVFYSYQK